MYFVTGDENLLPCGGDSLHFVPFISNNPGMLRASEYALRW